MHGLVEPGEVERTLEGVDLATEGVAPDGDVEPADGLLIGRAVHEPVGQHDHAGARPEDRQPRGDPLAQGVEQLEGPGQLGHRRRLPPRDHQPVAGVQLAGAAYGVAWTSSEASAARCSRTSPWRARTPTVGVMRPF